MKRKNLLTSLTLAGTLLALSGQAHATSCMDFSQLTNSVTISSASLASPTILRQVTVVCPAAGYLVTTAAADFALYSTATPGEGSIGYSISLNTGFDFSHYHFLSQYLQDGFDYIPAGMFRVDSCSLGQTRTYSFVAYRSAAGASTYAWQPRLVVEFFDKRI